MVNGDALCNLSSKRRIPGCAIGILYVVNEKIPDMKGYKLVQCVRKIKTNGKVGRSAVNDLFLKNIYLYTINTLIYSWY